MEKQKFFGNICSPGFPAHTASVDKASIPLWKPTLNFWALPFLLVPLSQQGQHHCKALPTTVSHALKKHKLWEKSGYSNANILTFFPEVNVFIFTKLSICKNTAFARGERAAGSLDHITTSFLHLRVFTLKIKNPQKIFFIFFFPVRLPVYTSQRNYT